MKQKVMIQKRIPKYFHSDGNGVHLKVDRKYLVEKEGVRYKILVLAEYRNFYLVMVNNLYRSTINKLDFDFAIIRFI